MEEQQYKHLSIEKEPLVNPRRTRQYKIPPIQREDLLAHGQRLSNALKNALHLACQENSSNKDRFVLKLQYSGMIDFNGLKKHGVEFVSQEEKQVCIVFASEKGLTQFQNHLAQLGLSESNLTYRQILEALDDVGNWTRKDRESWAIKHLGLPKTKNFRVDVELWPVELQRHPTRQKLIQDFENWLQVNTIRAIDYVNLDSFLMYRVEVTQQQIDLLLEHRDVRLVDLIPQTGILYHQLAVDMNTLPRQLGSPAANSARVCILDSGINSNHPLLKTSIAEGVSFIEGQSENDEDGHGTAVAGIVLYGDVEACLKGNYWKPEFWLFNGKILYRDSQSGEVCFDEKTIEKTLQNAVAYFAGERGCRIFNLSMGNLNAPYDHTHVRGMAYVIDCLAREYGVIFILSAGNFSGSENPPIPQLSWREEYPEYLLKPELIIIDPAPALNAITVGSIARHNAHVNEQRYPEIYALAPASEGQPSPFTRHGPSVRGAIKPELVAPGGNLAVPIRTEGKQWVKEMRGLGVLTCSHNFIRNPILKEISGTSFAAPYITHLAGRLLNEYPEMSANTVRALLVNHADLPRACETTFHETLVKQHRKKHRELPREVAGYGSVDLDILYRSTESGVVLIAEDSIGNDAHHFYELPLPAEFLRKKRAAREIRVTLSHCPPVRTTRLEYTATKIFYRLVKGKSLEEVQFAFNHATQEETETRSDDAINNRKISAELRDKGTVQSSIWQCRQLDPNYKWFLIVTRKDREWGGNLCLESEHYALVVTVTDKENKQPQLYTQIKNRIQVQQQERERIRM